MEEFVYLNPNMYAISEIYNIISERWKEMLLLKPLNLIPSNNHRTEKKNMSWFNDKIYIFDNAIHAWASSY